MQKTWTSYGAPTPENKSQLKTFPASMEVFAQFAAGSDAAGVELIRREWGFMLHDPLGTQSTFPEALRDNGCICSTYTSMSHGWATGPTGALTEYVLGLQPASAGGATWSFAPHPADLTFAQGRLQTTKGALDASWKVDGQHFSATLTAPAGTTGRIAVPTFGRNTAVFLDGKLVSSASSGPYVSLDGVAAGAHTVDAYPAGWVTTAGGTVPATLSLTLGAPASFGEFTPGVEKTYAAQTAATVTSTAGDASLSASGVRLANGAFTLADPVAVTPSKTSWSGPVSNDPLTIAFSQHVGANEALRTGAYTGTVTFTLSTTTP